jgi:hypothetical protein
MTEPKQIATSIAPHVVECSKIQNEMAENYAFIMAELEGTRQALEKANKKIEGLEKKNGS